MYNKAYKLNKKYAQFLFFQALYVFLIFIFYYIYAKICIFIYFYAFISSFFPVLPYDR